MIDAATNVTGHTMTAPELFIALMLLFSTAFIWIRWKRGAMTERRFPPPWSVDDVGDAFVVRDNTQQKIAQVYYEEDPGRQRAAKLLTKDQARRIAAKLTDLLRKD
jgi:hypothetical protein